IEHPQLTWAGVYVTNPDKAGRDAGELCGGGPTGIVATADIDEILAVKADCVLYMPLRFDADEVCRLLASGANIVTTTGGFHRVQSMDPALRERVSAACASGDTAIHSTRSRPRLLTAGAAPRLAPLQPP